MRTLMIITFLFCLGCTEENARPQFPVIDYPVGLFGLRTLEVTVTFDCQQNLFLVALLENRNETLKQYLALIKFGFLPDTGCSHGELQTCTQVIQNQISFNLFQIQKLKQGCI